MKLSIMQPYFCAYIGYYQLINNADKFVIYDNIEYTKKGWINRNRILLNNEPKTFTIPIKKDSDFLHIQDRMLTEDYQKTVIKILAQIKSAYIKAPYFINIFPLIESIFLYKTINLSDYINNSIKTICSLLKIDTEIILSSTIDIDHNKKSQEKVIEICKILKSETYINAIGGKLIYYKKAFHDHGIDLQFLETSDFKYSQNNNNFIANLSIIDVLMFNSPEEVDIMLNKYKIVK